MSDRRLLFFGDSHTLGVGDPTGRGWVGRVLADAFAAGVPLTAYNLGVRGNTSVQVAERWRREAQPRLSPESSTGLVLSFGVNDTTVESGRRRVECEHSLEALSTILDEAMAAGLPALVVGPAPVDDPRQNRQIDDLSASFGKRCIVHATPFVSVFEPLLSSQAWMDEVGAGDGAHPSSEGYSVLGQTVIAGGFLDWLAAIGER